MNIDKQKTKTDTYYSTYRWHIYLSNGKDYPGYSKLEGETEPADKKKLLFRCLQRLRQHNKKYPDMIQGYFTKGIVSCMEIFLRTGVGLYDEKLITLYPTFYEFCYNADFNSNKEVINFFREFYNELNAGMIIPATAKKKQLYANIGYSKKIDERQFFSLDSYRFPDIYSLNKFFEYGISIGYGFEVMNHFRNNYIEKNFKSIR